MSINKRLLSTLPLRTMSDLLFRPMYIYIIIGPYLEEGGGGGVLRIKTPPKCLSRHEKVTKIS
jgi:hypothetical protein